MLVALLFGCTRPAPPAPANTAAETEQPIPAELSPWSWSSISVASGKLAQVRQVPSGKGHCRVSATIGNENIWSLDACLATSADLRFISSDALALIVLKPLPGPDDVTLGAVYRKGKRVLALTPSSLHLPAEATRIEGNRFLWLGPREQREMADGVDVQLLDGSSVVIRFDGQRPAARANAPAGVAGLQAHQ